MLRRCIEKTILNLNPKTIVFFNDLISIIKKRENLYQLDYNDYDEEKKYFFDVEGNKTGKIKPNLEFYELA